MAPTNASDLLLRAEGVDYQLDGARILRGARLSVRAGELVGLIGPNGAGKSSLLRVVSGLWTATGGTIAETQADPMKAGCKTGALRVEDLIRAVPRIRGRADLTGEQFSNIASRNMDDRMWLRLAGRVNKLLRRGDVGGMVITHGTDTIEETAWFLNLVVKSGKPVVMTGAMRPATAVGADGPANLFNAVAVAAHPDAGGRGVLPRITGRAWITGRAEILIEADDPFAWGIRGTL